MAAALLARLLPPEHRETVLGDLQEELDRRGGGSVWYTWQALAISARFVLAGRGTGTLGHDVRLALRRLRRDPGFTLVAVLALALGIGLNAVILMVAQAVLFAPLPYPAEDRLAVVTNDHTGSSTGDFGVSWLNMRDVAERNRTLEDFTLFLDWQDVNYAGPDAAHRIPASFVDADYFRLLGLEAGIGRLPSADENRVGAAARVAVLGRGTWRRVFGGDPQVVGRTVTLNGRPYEIVGVLADDRGDLRYRWSLSPTGIFLPLFAVEDLTSFELREDRGMRALNALIRVREGASADEAHDDLVRVSGELAADHPEANEGWQLHVQALDEAFYEDLRAPAAALLAGAALLLLLVAVNLVNLLLIRATGREGEVAVRRALGAGSGRLVRQLLTEGVVLAGLGGSAGLFLAVLATDVVRRRVGAQFPAFVELHLGWGAWTLVGVATLALGALLGAVPAARLLGTDTSASLRAGGKHSDGRGTRRLKGSLIVSEVALAFVLLTGAGLMLESFRTLRATGYGFDTDDLLTARLMLRGDRYASDDAQRAFADELVTRGRRLPGVQSAFLWSPNRLGHGNQVDLLTVEGRWNLYPDERLEASQHALRPGTLERLGLPLLEGRDVRPSDDAEAPPVALVSESLGRALWPGEDPVGKRLETPRGGETVVYDVVGVVADARHRTRLIEPFGPQRDVYYAFDQLPDRGMTLALRLEPDAAVAPAAAGVRRLVRELDPNLPLDDVATMEARMRDEESRARLTALLVGLYAVLALALAALGVYGVLAHAVSRQTREIGIRMALGAGEGRVLGRVVARGMGLAVGGGVLGLVVALGGARLLASALYGVEPWDPGVFAGVAAVLGTVALGSTALPALRATRVDPARALREE